MAEASAISRRLRRDIATHQNESRQCRDESDQASAPVNPQVTLEVIGDKHGLAWALTCEEHRGPYPQRCERDKAPPGLPRLGERPCASHQHQRKTHTQVARRSMGSCANRRHKGAQKTERQHVGGPFQHGDKDRRTTPAFCHPAAPRTAPIPTLGVLPLCTGSCATALRLIEDDLTDSDMLWGDLHAFVLTCKLQGLLEREPTGRCQALQSLTR